MLHAFWNRWRGRAGAIHWRMCIRKEWPSIISNETRSDPYFRAFYFFSSGGYGLFMLEKILGAYKLPSKEHIGIQVAASLGGL